MSGFPDAFPGKEQFVEAGIGHHAALRMNRTELAEIVGEKTADQIIKSRQA